MEKTTGTRTGRKPKSDPADRKYSFRLNAEENTRFEKLLADSGAGDRTLFIKKSIFSGQIKVVKIDKATMDYYIKLTEFHRQFQAVSGSRLPGFGYSRLPGGYFHALPCRVAA